MPAHPSTLARYRGALLGLAACDALGTTVEFSPLGTFEPVTDVVGGGPFGLKPGEWTDDTSLALCLAESLVERRGFDAADQVQRYVRWWRHGHLGSNGRCFDIGTTVRTALSEFERTGNPRAGATSPQSAGNGSLMRLAPVPLFFGRTPAEAVHYAAESSKTTHGAAESADACRLMAALIVAALGGASKPDLLGAALPHRPPISQQLSPKSPTAPTRCASPQPSGEPAKSSGHLKPRCEPFITPRRSKKAP